MGALLCKSFYDKDVIAQFLSKDKGKKLWFDSISHCIPKNVAKLL